MRLQIEEIARKRGLTIEQIHQTTGIPLTQVRKLFYDSKSGLKRDKGTLTSIRLDSLDRIANALNATPGELFTRH